MVYDSTFNNESSSKKIANLTIKKRIPVYAFFELTRHCNLNCSHCYIVQEKKHELSTSEVKSAIGQLKKENCLILNFSGGEVFTRKDFFDIAWYAKDNGFAIKIFTNGALIDRDKADELAKLKPLRVEITIYSIEPQVHDSITSVKGSLRDSLTALRLLKEKKVPLRIKCPLMRQNASGYKDIINLAEDIGAKYQFDTNILPKTNGLKKACNFQIGRKTLANVFNDPKISINEKKILNQLDSHENDIFCGAAHNSCAITAYGDVLACIALPIRSGNLRKQPFSKIWQSSYVLQQIRAARMDDRSDCFRCGLSIYCNKCPGLAYLNEGDIFAKTKRACVLAAIRKNILKPNR